MKTPSVRLLVPLAALAAALFFVPAAPAAPAPTKLVLSGSSKAPGGITTLTAELTAAGKPLAGQAIGLFSGDATPLATGNTDASGRIAFEVTITEPTTFQAGYTPAPPDAAAYSAATSKRLEVTPTSGITLAPNTHLRARRKAVGIPHNRVTVRGTVAHYSAGSGITIDVFKGKRRVRHRAVGARQAGSKGRFSFSFKPGGSGVYRVRASRPAGSVSVRVFVVRPRASRGSRGVSVRALQSGLARLGYATPISGYFDDATARAVMAFRKVNRYSRSMNASLAVFRKLARGGGGFHVRHPKAGKHVEFDWSRQVLVLARGSKPKKILHASSGKPATPTVFGKFRFYSKTPGFNAKGMYYSNYFIGGYAIHGYESVPTYAASHGCIRIPIPSATAVYRWVGLGNTIYVYR